VKLSIIYILIEKLIQIWAFLYLQFVNSLAQGTLKSVESSFRIYSKVKAENNTILFEKYKQGVD